VSARRSHRGSARGAGILEYVVVVAGVAVVAFFAMSALGSNQSGVVEFQGSCVRTFDCRSAVGGATTIAIQGEKTGADGLLAGAQLAAAGTVEETGAAFSQPVDVMKGVEFLIDHPGTAFKAILFGGGKKKRGTGPGGAPTTAEAAGASATRVASSVGPGMLGRLATLGAVVRSGRSVEDWMLPPPPEAPEIMSADAKAAVDAKAEAEAEAEARKAEADAQAAQAAAAAAEPRGTKPSSSKPRSPAQAPSPGKPESRGDGGKTAPSGLTSLSSAGAGRS